MKQVRLFFKLASWFMLGVGVASAALAATAADGQAPDFTGTTMTGEQISLADFRGKAVVLEWTNHQCPYVRKHYGSGNMQKTQRTLTEDGAVWISITSSAPGQQGHISAVEAQQLTASRASYADHVVLDPSGSIGRLYGAKTTLHMFIVGETGALLYQGAIDDIPSASTRSLAKANNLVLAAWSQIQAGERVALPMTKPYGCTVKYSDVVGER